MSGFDSLILIVITASLIVGLWRGAVRELLSLLAWLITVWLSIKWGAPLAEKLVFIPPRSLRFALAYGAVILITRTVLQLLINRLDNWVAKTSLQSLNRTFGALFGLIRGLLLCVLVAIGAIHLGWHLQGWWQESYSGRVLLDLYPLLGFRLSDLSL